MTTRNVETMKRDLATAKQFDGPQKVTKYRILKDRSTGEIADIILDFGKWRGHRIRAMLEDGQGENYVFNFLLDVNSNFQEEFIERLHAVIKQVHPDWDPQDGPNLLWDPTEGNSQDESDIPF